MARIAWLAILLFGIGLVAVVAPMETTQWIPSTDHMATAKRKHKHKHKQEQQSLPPYTVKQSGSGNTNQLNTASASCDPGDEATGGGFEGVGSPLTQVVDSSPFDSINNENLVDTWTVDYTNGSTGDAVDAIVVCTDLKPAHNA